MKFVKIFTVISPLIVSFVFISSCSLFDSDGSKNTYSSSLTTTNPGLCADNEWSSDGTVSTNCQDCSKITNSTGQSSSDRKSCVCNTGYDWISTITKCSTDVLLGFTDKKILKISSAGGGADFTAVIESTSGFSTIPDYAYYLGNDGFDSDIAALLYAGGNTIICFSDGNILKMKGTGDTGTNLSFITKSGDTFSDVSGHNNIVGYDKFDKPVRSILYAGGNTILSFTDDNLLKIKGTGGTGADFTAINKSGDAISNMTGYSYLAGYDKFDSVITAMSYAEGNTILSFLDHNVLKMKGTGGTGAHFTAVNKSGDSFSNVTGYSYLLGYDKFNWSVTSVIYAEGNTLMSFADGNVLKMKGTGG
ncbi:MAG: hypothetical protein NTY22_09515, partial [Proteobacteria bacterium]|nr:hypothetical protein [Pseudomonadota bacterium]